MVHAVVVLDSLLWYVCSLQPADFDVEEELLSEEVLKAEDEEEQDEDEEAEDDEQAAAAASRLLLESPEGSIAHEDLG